VTRRRISELEWAVVYFITEVLKDQGHMKAGQAVRFQAKEVERNGIPVGDWMVTVERL
jgi:hypothetical protein